MASVPVWLIGKHVTACQIFCGVTVAANGTITDGSGTTIYGHLADVNIESQNELENISEMAQRRQNFVIIESGTTFVLTELLKSNGTNILASAGYVSDYVKITLTRGGQSFTFYGVIESYSESLVKGSGRGVMRVRMVDSGAANPSYA